MTPVEICRELLSGIVADGHLPELRDDDVRTEVETRLESVGCRLRYSQRHNCWITYASGPLSDEAPSDSPESLNTKDRAVLATCWLHLRYLPIENSEDTEWEDGLFPDSVVPLEVPLDIHDIIDQLSSLPPQAINISVGKLKRLRYLIQREGLLVAGPMMEILDEISSAEQARRMLLRHERLRRTTLTNADSEATEDPRPDEADDASN